MRQSSPQNDVKAVIFDVGGVLCRDVWEWMLVGGAGALEEAPGSVAARYGVSRERLRLAGERSWEAFETRSDGPAGALEREYWALLLRTVPDLARRGATIDELIGMTDEFIVRIEPEAMTGLLGDLRRRGRRLAICSDNVEFWYRRQMAGREGEWDDLHGFFPAQRVVLSCREGLTKRSPQTFRRAAGGLGLRAARCVFVDDRRANVEQAVATDMVAVHFRGAHEREPPCPAFLRLAGKLFSCFGAGGLRTCLEHLGVL